MIISMERFEKACRRLAKYKADSVEREKGPLTYCEREAIISRACIPRMYVKLAKRLFARGHMLVDFGTHEIIRNF
jgi:hypothetical protein